MKVLILGFAEAAEINNVMKKLIAENGCFLFYVVVGKNRDAAVEWAESVGAPQFHIDAKKPDDLEYWSDYIVLKINDDTPQWQKNLMMKFKVKGKHGTVIKS